jgi:hypothetical protein
VWTAVESEVRRWVNPALGSRVARDRGRYEWGEGSVFLRLDWLKRLGADWIGAERVEWPLCWGIRAKRVR